MMIQYEIPVTFTESDFTSDGVLKPGLLIYEFQDAGAEHMTREHVGFTDLMERELMWVLTKMKYKLYGKAEPNKEYKIVTAPCAAGSYLYYRDYVLYDGDTVVAVLSSEWCIVNFNTRKVVQTDIIKMEGEYCDGIPMLGGIKRLRPRNLVPKAKYTVKETDLDGNDHMNNRRYIDVALDAMGKESVNELTINFAKETRLGDSFDICLSEDGSMVSGVLPDGTLVFALAAE